MIPWLNAFNFLTTYTEIDGWQPDAHTTIMHPLDRWVQSSLNRKERLTKQMTEYKLYNVVPELLIMIDELTNIYIRMSRPRFGQQVLMKIKKQLSKLYTNAYMTLVY